MASFLMFWCVLSVVGVLMSVFMVRGGRTDENQRMIPNAAKGLTNQSRHHIHL